ncbi:hypothetical protein Bp8pS_154 [Bacillus phage vB_BpuM-BpSp]|nr:hypothetical protein Bp8pS_154 [Bacillus phage vB_BpuM-BpSp]
MTLDLTGFIKDMIKKEKLGEEARFVPSYRTGLDALDYRIGKYDEGEKVIGLEGGKIVTVIGKSGVGKTSMVIDIAKNIVDPFKYSNIIHLDYERSTSMSRIRQVTGWSTEKAESKYILLNREIYSDTLFQLIKKTARMKVEKFNELKIDTGKVDNDGNPIFVLPPTVIIVDSWALLTPKELDEKDELSGSMTAAAIAKTNNQIMKRSVSELERGNIMLLVINHINQKIDINPMQKTQAQVNYMKQDESIPGGGSAIYLANTLIKLVASSKLEKDKDFGIKGFKVNIEILKSRSNEAGSKVETIYSQEKGYQNTLTSFNLLKPYLKGNGRAYYYEELPDVKFTQKNFEEKYNSIPELKEVFDKKVDEVLSEYLSGESDPFLNEPEDGFNIIEELADGYFLVEDPKTKEQFRYDQKTGEATPIEVEKG